MAETGVPVMLTTGGPALDTPVEMIGWYADLLDRYEFTEDLGTAEARGGQHRRWVEKEAVGVAAAIVPYNYPLQISLAKLVPALAAGCTVVLKGPPDTPWLTSSIGRSSPSTPRSRRASSTSSRRPPSKWARPW